MQLSKILLDDYIIVVLGNHFAILIMIYSFLSIAFNHPLSEEFHGFVGYLTFPSTLLGSLQKFHRVEGPSSLII